MIDIHSDVDADSGNHVVLCDGAVANDWLESHSQQDLTDGQKCSGLIESWISRLKLAVGFLGVGHVVQIRGTLIMATPLASPVRQQRK